MTPADTALAEKLLRLLSSKKFQALAVDVDIESEAWIVTYGECHGECPPEVVIQGTLAAAVDAALERVEQPKTGGEPCA